MYLLQYGRPRSREVGILSIAALHRLISSNLPIIQPVYLE